MSIPNMYPCHQVNLNQIKENITSFLMKVILQKPRKK